MGSFASSHSPTGQPAAPASSAVRECLPELATASLSTLRPAARRLMRLCEFEQARALWERIAELAPMDFEPRMALGRIHARNGQAVNALSRLREVLRLQPAHDEARRLCDKVSRTLIEDLCRRVHAEPDNVAASIAELEPLLGEYRELQQLRVYLKGRVDGQETADLLQSPSADGEAPPHTRLRRPTIEEPLSRAGERSACGDDIASCARAVRQLFDAGDDIQALAEVRELLSTQAPFEKGSESVDAALRDIFRRVRTYVWRTRAIASIAEHECIARERDDGGARSQWILGMLASARLDQETAAAHFARVPRDHANFSPAFELALLYERLHHFGKAHAIVAQLGGMFGVERKNVSRFARLDKVVEFCGWHEDLRYPECLIDVIFEEIEQGAIGYVPHEGHLLTVTSSLRPGGSERQTVAVLAEMVRDPRIARIVLAIRSEDRGDRSFLRAARELPIDIVHYGCKWAESTDIMSALPQLRDRPRLAAAIELLPHNLREDIVRLAKLILEVRPKAVHLRQDLFAGAIGCALAGVPKFLCHRGSLSPDLWGLGPFEMNLFVRPMRHTYRKLFAAHDFALVNNSTAGAKSDQDWSGWPDKARFRVVYNAVDFEALAAPGDGDVRAQQGIPKNAFLVAGVFRIEAVKRPRLWIDVARIVADICPDAHFVVLGGGAMADEMRAHAEARGLGRRFHMSGFVSNVGEWLRAVDLVMLTSDREGLPNVLIEGQHFGVPAVASDVGGTFETMEPGVTGILVSPDAGAEAYASAVIRIIRDPLWRAQAKSAAPAYVRSKFGSRQTVGQLLDQLGMEAAAPRNCTLQSTRHIG